MLYCNAASHALLLEDRVLAHGPKLVDEQGKCRIKVSRDLYLPQPLDDTLAVDQGS
jgi:hypothetical protein